MDPRQLSQMNNFEEDNRQNQRSNDLLDLTLRLGISTLNPTHNANAFTGTQDTNPLGDYISDPTASTSTTVGDNGHLYCESYHEIEFEFPAPPEMDQFCLLNISRRRPNAGGSRRRSTTSRRRSPPPDADQTRICTNFNCRITNSPMWRRGPLGPKTLCNACGIKYRKLKLKEGSQAEEGAARQAWPGLV